MFRHFNLGRTVAEAICCQPFGMEVQVQSQSSPCGICGGQSDTGTSFSEST